MAAGFENALERKGTSQKNFHKERIKNRLPGTVAGWSCKVAFGEAGK